MRNMRFKQGVLFMLVVVFLSVNFLSMEAFARAGGGRSFGSRGARSFSSSRSYSSPSRYATQRPYSSPVQGGLNQSSSGSFMRGLAGGVAGGFLGSMLFRGTGYAGGPGGGYGGGGLGMFDLLLFAGVGYFAYRYFMRKSQTNIFRPTQTGTPFSRTDNEPYPVTVLPSGEEDDLDAALADIRRLDPAFSEEKFSDQVMDLFFKIQGAWMNRDLSSVRGILTDEINGVLQADIDQLKRNKQINRLENIAVRKVDVTAAWQEMGQDYITAQIYANLLDYTTDESGAVLSGSKVDPVKFEEYWTFVRHSGGNPWSLSAIEQKA